MNNPVAVWKEPSGTLVPKDASTASEIAKVATTLSSRDQHQIVTAYNSQAYEMMALFVMNKAFSQLKRQLASLGMEFVGEMLGRPDLNEDSVPTVSLSDYEAVTLARSLGIINSTDAKRLTQHLELLAHFNSLEREEAENEEMSQQEALQFLRTCVDSVLGRKDNFAPVEFVQFRSALEGYTFKATDTEVQTLSAAPYFFKKTTLSILLAGLKTRTGAQFEHVLGNVAAIVPILWPHLKDAERWSIGQAYAEMVNAGNSVAVIGLKRALTAVRGFDFVPESLRSQTFSAAASNVIQVHTSSNNFYNEPAAIAALAKLGTTIPGPAFPICMSATLAVFLGNAYGVSYAAQADAKGLLTRLNQSQWSYYLNECLPDDELILQKLSWNQSPRDRWSALVYEFNLGELSPKSPDVKRLLLASQAKEDTKIAAIGTKLLAARGK
jgi:hypothetical protein